MEKQMMSKPQGMTQRDWETTLVNRERNRKADDYDGLLAINAELLAALEAVVAISDRKHDAWDMARAAIARAKGEA